MRKEQLNKGQRADIVLNNLQWSIAQWEDFCHKNNCGLIIEKGKVTGFITNPVEYRV